MTINRSFMHSIRLHYNKDRVRKDGTASLYLRVIISREKKDFLMDLSWPADKIDIENQKLLPRHKKDNEVSDYNLIIDCEKARHTEIQLTYRLRNEDLTMVKLIREIKIFSTKECFATYIELERNSRYRKKEIEKNTWQNAHATKISLLEYDPLCLFKNINLKWLKGFKSYLTNKGYKPGTVWAKISATKAYLRLASQEPLIYVDQEVLNFPNPKVATTTTYLDVEELRRLILLLEFDLTDVQFRVLQAFLFTCFTSLRISDLYSANSTWEEQNGFLDFLPYKNRKNGKWIRIPLIPIARQFINKGEKYFKLPNMVEYNETLKELADKAEINKNLTSHVGRHTFGFLYMTHTQNIY
ncbi:MAG: hypothetical protein EOP00_32170, partial [Pedobacter sp.]